MQIVANFTAVELDISPIDAAIQEAQAAKEGIAVSEDGQDVPAGTYWVTQGDIDALDEAFAVAEATKGTVETQQDVTDIVEILEAAVLIFNEAKQEATAEEEENAGEETEDPSNEQEAKDDEDIEEEQVGTEEDIDEGEIDAVDEEETAYVSA